MIDPPAPTEGGNDEPEPASLDEAAEAIAERAIGSVLEQLPAGDDPDALETSVRYQPWADTAVPAGKNKRPLEELLAELGARVEACPDAVAGSPTERHPAAAFFDRFGAPRRTPDEHGRRRGRRRRDGGRGPARSQQPPAAAAADAGPTTAPRSGGRRRRRSRGRGRGGRGGGAAPAG
ncbi:MAG: hypothetical protein E6J14_00660 [Chloroflexi bacterium]|nr:MAG: hypothetical protein E6J14_00660 [Chloroflexota bacterium]